MNIDPNLTLEDDIVLLRPLLESDFENLLPFAINEPELWKYSLVPASSKENWRNYLKVALSAKAEASEFPFVVIDKTTGKYAGSTRFYDINFGFKTIQLGYTWYGKEFQGTGLNKHCKYLLLEYVFETLGFERFELRADNNNARSKAAMASIGCKVDGILRSNMPTYQSDERRDSIVFSILKCEWFDSVKERLRRKL